MSQARAQCVYSGHKQVFVEHSVELKKLLDVGLIRRGGEGRATRYEMIRPRGTKGT
jgi:hypothetical protein